MTPVEAIAEAWYRTDPSWNTAPARRELAQIAVQAVVDWLHSEGPTAMLAICPDRRPEDRLADVCEFVDLLLTSGREQVTHE